jgi:hypothetical protein
MLPIHSAINRAYCLVVMLHPCWRKSPGFFGAALKYSLAACRVGSVSSNLTGRAGLSLSQRWP